MTPVFWKGRDVPSGAFRGTVHSVFRRACNLLDDEGRLWALLDPELPRTAWSVRLPFPFAERLEPGMSFAGDGRTLSIPSAGLAADLASARSWQADFLPTGGGPVSVDARRRLLGLAGAAGWPGLCVLFAPDADQPDRNVLDAVVFARFVEGRERLTDAARRGSVPEAVAAARSFLGLGVGLTPAGDDFTGGFLAGLRVGADGEARRAFAEAFGAELLPHVAPSTNRIAAAYLVHACAGSFSETVAGLARTLQHGCSGPELDRRVRALLAFGATSGADTLAGLLASFACGGAS